MTALVWVLKEKVIWKATVNERSMLPTLQPDETVWINKRAKPQRNELAVFDLAKGEKATNELQYLKRCIGTPGDTIDIINQRVFVNFKEIELPAQSDYLIQCDGSGLSKEQQTRFGLNQGGMISSKQLYKFSIGDSLAQLLEQEANVLYLKKYTNGKGIADPLKIRFVEDLKALGWNLDQLGPLYCPRNGDKLPFTQQNFNLYKPLLETYEQVSIKFFEEQGYVNNVLSETIPFERNYFFFIGDNRHHSKDSRNFGLVPEENIVGTVISF